MSSAAADVVHSSHSDNSSFACVRVMCEIKCVFACLRLAVTIHCVGARCVTTAGMDGYGTCVCVWTRGWVIHPCVAFVSQSSEWCTRQKVGSLSPAPLHVHTQQPSCSNSQHTTTAHLNHAAVPDTLCTHPSTAIERSEAWGFGGWPPCVVRSLQEPKSSSAAASHSPLCLGRLFLTLFRHRPSRSAIL
jgi:hypothetical protein